ncbi:hypothetical protein ACLPJG_27245 [Pseudomonas aeruginosa]|jgi:hypothetical protein|uniref:Uncharacterized protein n=1 Tax=Pseudomonas syringae pv. delphinii TaxID=192088 RepID=A0A3M4JV02_9PSED|nr:MULTISPECIES: hypothetical protein [Pseudomonas]MCT8191171.1 hypothetical protein [Pseudomonas monteilii]RFQ05752.1 hypothetical protein D0O09_03040 [Pseudomonas putida]RMQ20867.1 hypothetical protein ALQ08_200126 [Pseudomonas syringae pv. delphinii]
MSNQESSSEYVDPAPGTAAKGPLIIASLLLAVPVLFVVFAVISAAVLNFKAPVSPEDLKHASWLVTPPTLSFFLSGVSVFAFVIGAFRAFMGSAFGLVLIMAGIVSGTTIFPSVSFRSAVLAGEAKVGCYDYTSSACTKMLGLPDAAASEQSSKVEGKTLAAIEVLAFVRAPFDVFKADQLNQMLDAQRLELKTQLDAYAE